MPPFRPTHDQPVTLAQLRLLEPELLVGGELPSPPVPPSLPHRPAKRAKLTYAPHAHAEISRLENSIAHLERSNVELAAFVRGEDGGDGEELDDETRREFEDSVKENEETMCVPCPLSRSSGRARRERADPASTSPAVPGSRSASP